MKKILRKLSNIVNYNTSTLSSKWPISKPCSRQISKLPGASNDFNFHTAEQYSKADTSEEDDQEDNKSDIYFILDLILAKHFTTI